ncbi:unnamed protein product [Caenorhabditis sp. 36 PRJEB53466]|nr:unnamed protein product [Caenorhabditis sp. 36 PRJEB53466]
MDHQLHQSRNLSVNQTLDEILGIHRKTDPSGSNGTEKNSVNSAMRPPTRHGRESAGSNEENKDPITTETSSENGNGHHFAPPSVPTEKRRHSDDDFIKKLNEIRRRSLISTMDIVPETANNSTVQNLELHSDDSSKREPRPRLAIHVEEADETIPTVAFSANLRQNSIGTNEEQSLTFRVDEKTEQKAARKGPVSKRPESGISTKKEENLMVQRSFFNSTKSADAHHKEWLLKKEKEMKMRRMKEKEEEERKKQQEKDRRENSAKLYQRWVQEHDEKMRKFKEMKKSSERERQEKAKTEKTEKKKEAEKNYEIWRRQRSKSVTEIRRKNEEDAEKKRKAEEEERAEKRKEAQSAFLAWKRQKEEFLSSEARKLRKEEREKQETEERLSKDFRFMCATEAYETWIEMKEKEREMLADLVLIEAPPIPWIPPSNLVPRHFVRRSARGQRPKPRSQSAKSIGNRTRGRPSTTNSLRPFR